MCGSIGIESIMRHSKNHTDTTLSVGYGMTEVAATDVTSTPQVNRIGTVGIPLPGTFI